MWMIMYHLRRLCFPEMPPELGAEAALQLCCSPLPCRGCGPLCWGWFWAAPLGGRPEGCAQKGGGEVRGAVGGVVLLQPLPEASVGLGSFGVCV